jgi:hypothetical protein
MDEDVAPGQQADLAGQGDDGVALGATAGDERAADEPVASGDGDHEVFLHLRTPAAEAA